MVVSTSRLGTSIFDFNIVFTDYDKVYRLLSILAPPWNVGLVAPIDTVYKMCSIVIYQYIKYCI